MVNHTYVIIFDWDDTLLDAGHALTHSQLKALQVMLKKTEIYPFTKDWQCPSVEELRAHTGHRFKERVIYDVMPQLKKAHDEHQNWIETAFEQFKNFYRQETKFLFPGIKNMLTQLQSECDLCIATNKSRDLFIEESQETEVTHLFSTIICGDDPVLNGHFKPNPRMINIIQKEHPQTTRFVMVGDRKFDIEAAQASIRANNTRTIGITQDQNRLLTADQRLTSSADITMDLIMKLFDR